MSILTAKDGEIVAEARRDAEHHHDFQADEVLKLVGIIERQYGALNRIEAILQSSFEFNDARKLWDIGQVFWPNMKGQEPPSDDGLNELRGGTPITRAQYRDQRAGMVALAALRNLRSAMDVTAEPKEAES